ncbi:MAG: DUF86 domain-containing protein [Muribaculaceae bacterium]|nr:DUF86 domain-containing protein [Muribaculaceae bacterium]
MDEVLKKYLYDVKQSINNIEIFMNERSRNYNVFCNDLLYQHAVERNLAIIGEAINRILKIKPDIKISSARKIVNLRNFIIHAYDSLQPVIIWGILINHLPVLKKEVDILLNES